MAKKKADIDGENAQIDGELGEDFFKEADVKAEIDTEEENTEEKNDAEEKNENGENQENINVEKPQPAANKAKENPFDISPYVLEDYEIHNFLRLISGEIHNIDGEMIAKYKERMDTFEDHLQERSLYHQSLILDYNDLVYLDQIPEGLEIKNNEDNKEKYTVQDKFAMYPDINREILEKSLTDELVRRYTKTVLGDGPFYIRIKNYKPEIKGFEMVKSEKQNRFIEIKGELIKIGDIYPKLRTVVMRCRRCGEFSVIEENIDGQSIAPTKCDSDICKLKTPIREWEYIPYLSKQIDYRHLMIREPFSIMDLRNDEMKPLHVFITADAIHAIRSSSKKYRITGVLKGTPMGFTFQENTFKTPLLEIGLWVSYIEPIEKNPNELDVSKFTPEMCEDKVSVVQDGHRYYGDFRDKPLPLFKTEYYMKELLPQIKKKRDDWKTSFNSLIASKITGGSSIQMIKNACRLVLTGAYEWVSEDRQQKRRKHIHMLLAGDPGTGKSSIGLSLINFREGARYASTTGATGIGLIGSVEKDDFSPNREAFCLKPGLLSLASGSIVVIDEFDKFETKDSQKLLQQMEHQLMSIDKASIHETLIADTTDVMIANPTSGRFNFDKTFAQNMSSISPPIFSRCDIKFMVYDIDRRTKRDGKLLTPADLHELQYQNDEKISTFILSKGKPDRYDNEYDDEDGLNEPFNVAITQKEVDEADENLEFAKFFLKYTDKKVEDRRNKNLEKRGEEPIILSKKAFQSLNNFYLKIKDNSYGEYSTGVSSSNREIEALERLTIANAKFFLKPVATSEDAEEAISVMRAGLESISFDFGLNGLPDLTQFDSPHATGVQVENQQHKHLEILADLLDQYPDGVQKELYAQKLVESGMIRSKGKKSAEIISLESVQSLYKEGFLDINGSYYILSSMGKETINYDKILANKRKEKKKQTTLPNNSATSDDIGMLVQDVMNKSKKA